MAWLKQQAREWAPLLASCTEADLDDLRDEVAVLPRRDVSLQVPLPRLLPPALERLRGVVARDDPDDEVASTLAAALPELDTPALRARLARAVLALHDDDHRIGCELTAYAMIDLADEPWSMLVVSALHQAMAVSTGSAPTPSGLVIAGR